MLMYPMDDILTTKEAARYLKVSEEFLRLLIRKKKIRAYKEGRRGGFRILKQDIGNYVKQKLQNEE